MMIRSEEAARLSRVWCMPPVNALVRQLAHSQTWDDEPSDAEAPACQWEAMIQALPRRRRQA